MNRRKADGPRGVLKTSAAEPQRYLHARFHPSPDLGSYVEHYWSVRWDLRGLAPARAETLPHPSVHMTFEHDVGGRIIGVARGKFTRLLGGTGGVIAAKFKPGGFYPFAKVSVSAFTGTTMHVTEVFGPEGNALERAVLAQSIDQSRIAIIEDFLRHRKPKPDEHVVTVAEIVYTVSRDRDILRVEDLVGRYGLTKRTLQRLFAKYVGVNPKWVIQRYRLHEASERLAAAESVTQSALAHDLGYSDQAHFVRDFKAVVGMSPAAYALKVQLGPGSLQRNERSAQPVNPVG
jgi:AraC-like DNA-binding protein